MQEAVDRSRDYIDAFSEAKKTLGDDEGVSELAIAVLTEPETRGLVPAGTLNGVLAEIAERGRRLAGE